MWSSEPNERHHDPHLTRFQPIVILNLLAASLLETASAWAPVVIRLRWAHHGSRPTRHALMHITYPYDTLQDFAYLPVHRCMYLSRYAQIHVYFESKHMDKSIKHATNTPDHRSFQRDSAINCAGNAERRINNWTGIYQVYRKNGEELLRIH